MIYYNKKKDVVTSEQRSYLTHSGKYETKNFGTRSLSADTLDSIAEDILKKQGITINRTDRKVGKCSSCFTYKSASGNCNCI